MSENMIDVDGMDVIVQSHTFRYSDTFDVVVGSGDSQRTFKLHSIIFQQRSTFFASAMSGRWSEYAANERVLLTEDDPAIFDLYLRVAYEQNNRLYLDDNVRDLRTYSNEDDDKLSLLYVRVFVLADKLGDTISTDLLLQGLIATGYEACATCMLGPEATAYAWAYTPAGSPLRRLALDSWVKMVVSDGTLAQHLGSAEYAVLPQEFLLELVADIARRRIIDLEEPRLDRVLEHGFILEQSRQGRYRQRDPRRASA